MGSSIFRRAAPVLAMLAFSAFCAHAGAEPFPNKDRPVRLIVPFTAGSSFDAGARAYAQALSEDLGANVVVENRPGADGVIGVSAAKTAAPDGYTILFTSLSTQVVNPHIFKKLAYDPINDFIPLIGTMKTTLVMAGGAVVPAGHGGRFSRGGPQEPRQAYLCQLHRHHQNGRPDGGQGGWRGLPEYPVQVAQ